MLFGLSFDQILQWRPLIALFVTIFVLLYVRSTFVSPDNTTSTPTASAKVSPQSNQRRSKPDDRPGTKVFTLEDIAICIGSTQNPQLNKLGFTSSDILLSVNGEVYDVSNGGQELYGPLCPYSVFAGCDSTIALARMTVDKKLCNRFDWDTLTDGELSTLAQWILKYRSKYEYVGTLKEAQGARLDLSKFNCKSYD